MLHFFILLYKYCSIDLASCINYYFQLCKWLVLAFLVLRYCITLKFHYLMIVLIAAHFHAIFYYRAMQCCILK